MPRTPPPRTGNRFRFHHRRTGAGLAHRATLAGMDAAILGSILVPIIGTVIAVGHALAGLMLRTAARQDRRMDRFEDAMSDFRAEMRRLAEPQSHVEGRLDERGAAAD